MHRTKEIIMSRIHHVRPLATLVTALALFTFALAVSPHGAARAATTAVTYTVATATFTPSSCDVPPCQVLSDTFTGPGTTTAAGVPASGDFTWTFTASKHASSNSCAFTQGAGSLDVTWADATTTEVTFDFKARDAHSWAIKGQVTAGSNAFYPTSPQTPVSGVVGYPPNPCTGATVPATISFLPPVPS
jgi:hypothetical protein